MWRKSIKKWSEIHPNLTSFYDASWRPTWPPKSFQNRRKIDQKSMKNQHQHRPNCGMHVDVGLIGILSPTWADLGPTWPQLGSNLGQLGSTWPPFGGSTRGSPGRPLHPRPPKTPPRPPQDAPRPPQDPPRHPQKTPKTPSQTIQEALRNLIYLHIYIHIYTYQCIYIYRCWTGPLLRLYYLDMCLHHYLNIHIYIYIYIDIST